MDIKSDHEIMILKALSDREAYKHFLLKVVHIFIKVLSNACMGNEDAFNSLLLDCNKDWEGFYNNVNLLSDLFLFKVEDDQKAKTTIRNEAYENNCVITYEFPNPLETVTKFKNPCGFTVGIRENKLANGTGRKDLSDLPSPNPHLQEKTKNPLVPEFPQRNIQPVRTKTLEQTQDSRTDTIEIFVALAEYWAADKYGRIVSQKYFSAIEADKQNLKPAKELLNDFKNIEESSLKLIEMISKTDDSLKLIEMLSKTDERIFELAVNDCKNKESAANSMINCMKKVREQVDKAIMDEDQKLSQKDAANRMMLRFMRYFQEVQELLHDSEADVTDYSKAVRKLKKKIETANNFIIENPAFEQQLNSAVTTMTYFIEDFEEKIQRWDESSDSCDDETIENTQDPEDGVELSDEKEKAKIISTQNEQHSSEHEISVMKIFDQMDQEDAERLVYKLQTMYCPKLMNEELNLKTFDVKKVRLLTALALENDIAAEEVRNRGRSLEVQEILRNMENRDENPGVGDVYDGFEKGKKDDLTTNLPGTTQSPSTYKVPSDSNLCSSLVEPQ